MRKNRFLSISIILACLAVSCLLLLSAGAQTGSPPKAADDPYQRIYEEQVSRTKRYDALLVKQEELMKKQEAACLHYIAILDKLEGANTHFAAVLDRWDKQQGQYQKYLDSLPTSGAKK